MQPSSTNEAKPRNTSIDFIRGVALLGILVINMQAFAMVSATYANPMAAGQSTFDVVLWCIQHVLADQKFMGIFSMLFGVGLAIFTDNVERRGGSPLYRFYRRLFWLALFGCVHAYLVWHGDILVTYAICGLFVFWLRRLSPRKLFAAAVGTLVLGACVTLTLQILLPFMSAIESAELAQEWRPDANWIAYETGVFRSGWWEQMELRVLFALGFQMEFFVLFTFWRASGLMLLGMGLYRAGFFDSEGRGPRYLQVAAAGIVSGLVLSGSGLVYNFAREWSMEASMLAGGLFNYCGGIAMSVGYMALLMLVPAGFVLRAPIEAVGRTAFSNYILQSVLATWIFYGHGLGLFGLLSRAEQWFVIVGIWTVQIGLTLLWLRFYKMGPLEWLWRKLTYGWRAD